MHHIPNHEEEAELFNFSRIDNEFRYGLRIDNQGSLVIVISKAAMAWLREHFKEEDVRWITKKYPKLGRFGRLSNPASGFGGVLLRASENGTTFTFRIKAEPTKIYDACATLQALFEGLARMPNDPVVGSKDRPVRVQNLFIERFRLTYKMQDFEEWKLLVMVGPTMAKWIHDRSVAGVHRLDTVIEASTYASKVYFGSDVAAEARVKGKLLYLATSERQLVPDLSEVGSSDGTMILGQRVADERPTLDSDSSYSLNCEAKRGWEMMSLLYGLAAADQLATDGAAVPSPLIATR